MSSWRTDGLGDDLETLFVVDQEAQSLAHDRVVIGDDHGRLASVGADGARRGAAV